MLPTFAITVLTCFRADGDIRRCWFDVEMHHQLKLSTKLSVCAHWCMAVRPVCICGAPAADSHEFHG